MLFTKVASVLAFAVAVSASSSIFAYPEECKTTCSPLLSLDAVEGLEDKCAVLEKLVNDVRSCYICARQSGASVNVEAEQSALDALVQGCGGAFETPDLVADAEKEAGHAALSAQKVIPEAEEPVSILNADSLV